jgi:predicted metal-dependent hydrolase
LMLAEERGFVVEGFSVRSQRGRWGSCSRRGAISLNMKLLFLPEDLSDHVLLHELCHTRHMDHSPAFWALMREHDRDSESKNRLLRVASKHVPAWLDAGTAGSERGMPSL